MDYQDWIGAVDAVFKAQRSGLSTKDIPAAVLSDAFQASASPVVFARDYLRTAPPAKAKDKNQSWLPLATTAALCLVFIGFILASLRQRFGEESIELSKNYPVELPVKTMVGDYNPPETKEVVEATWRQIRAKTLNPDLTRLVTSTVFVYKGRKFDGGPGTYAHFQVQGTIEAINELGTPIQEDWVAEVRRRNVRTVRPGVPGSSLEGEHEWNIVTCKLGRTAKNSIWKETNGAALFQADNRLQRIRK